jgi:hypothetical protein
MLSNAFILIDGLTLNWFKAIILIFSDEARNLEVGGHVAIFQFLVGTNLKI